MPLVIVRAIVNQVDMIVYIYGLEGTLYTLERIVPSIPVDYYNRYHCCAI
jgi:hypothetical protein